jgi:hypothetical protein
MPSNQQLGILDYTEILQGIDPGVRTEVYTKLLKGEGGQPGLEWRFIEVLSQLRIFETNLEQRNAELAMMPDDPVQGDGPKSSLQREVAGIAMQTTNQRAALNAVGSELREIQKALNELKMAGT